MSKKGFGLGDVVRISAAAARAVYGDYSAAAIESARIAARSSKIIITIIIGFLLIFTVLITSLKNLIPGFEELYNIYSYINPSTQYIGLPTKESVPKAMPTTNSNIFFPIPFGNSTNFTDSFGDDRYTDGQNRNHEGIDIFANRNTPLLALEAAKIIKIGWDTLGGWRILLESLDGNRMYYYAHLEKYSESLEKYRDMSGVIADPETEIHAGDVLGYVGTSGSFTSDSKPGADTGTPPHLHFQMWIHQKDKFILINPYEFLKLIEVSKFSLPIK